MDAVVCDNGYMQRRFHIVFARKLSINLLIDKWYKLFDYTSYICNRKSSGAWPVTDAQVDEVQGSLIQSASKSTMLAA